MKPGETLKAYAEHAERLAPDNLEALRALLAPDIHFTDPFNDVHGVDAYLRVLAKMFRDVKDVRIHITDQVMSGDIGYLRWDFTFRFRGRDWEIPGMSEVQFDAGGQITRHIDHWDSGRYFFSHLPIIGRAIKWIARRAGA